MSCPMFNTHFVRDGNNNYAIVQGDESVAHASYTVSERPSSSSIGFRSFAGRVDKPQGLYQWANVSAPLAPAAPEAPEASAPSTGTAYNNSVSFLFPVVKGCVYFIQIQFASIESPTQTNSIHWTVDPNKRRVVSAKKRPSTDPAAAADASIAPAASTTSKKAASSAGTSEAAADAATTSKKPKRSSTSKKAPVTLTSESATAAY